MGKFVIFNTIKVTPGGVDEFRDALLVNAAASVREEADCHAFHVMTPEGESDTLKLFELFTDEAAFDAHRETAHVKEFNERVGHLMVSRDTERFSLLN